MPALPSMSVPTTTNGTASKPNCPPPHVNMDAPNKPNALYYEENGRCYDNFRRGQYLFPVDREECNTMDIFHKFFSVARGDRFTGLHQLPLPHEPRILDIGCGTGIWAMDMAELLKARVTGWDLSLIQPEFIAQNTNFEQLDAEEDWKGVKENEFDLIHMRLLAGAFRDWSAIYKKVFRHLKPGTGILEQVEIDYRPLLENDEPPQGTNLLAWSQAITEATARAGRPLALNPNTKGELESMGFVDVEAHVTDVHFNPWSSDPAAKDRARWFNLAFTNAFMGLSLAPLTRYGGWTAEQVAEFKERVKFDICNRNLRAKCQMVIWTARKPL